MKKLFLPEDTLANKISYYHLLLLLLSLPYDLFYSHLILISFAVHTLINLKKRDLQNISTLKIAALSGVFFVTVISTAYSVNKPQAFNEWARQVVMLLFPVVLSLNAIDIKKYRGNLLFLFSCGVTLSVIYLYLQVLITIEYYHLPFSALVSAAFTNHNFSQPFDIHATFLSLQLAMAFIYTLYTVIISSQRYRQTIGSFCCLVLLAGLIQLSSKSVFIALLLIILVVIPWFLFKGIKRVKFVVSALLCTGLLAVAIIKTDNLKEHYFTDMQKDLSKASDDELADPRLARWQVALQVAAQSPIIGHGAGSEVELLKQRFFEHKFYRSYLAGLNAHNLYISMLVKSGIIGLLVYLAVLAFGFREAFDKKDLLFFAFMTIVAVVSFSENVLDVDKGIFF